jgi:hypothetical protein
MQCHVGPATVSISRLIISAASFQCAISPAEQTKKKDE